MTNSKRKKFTQEDIDLICNLYKQGKTVRQICNENDQLKNRKPQTLYPILIKNGLYRKKPADDLRRYKVDDNYFNIIDSEHKAYWLGFMIADGFLSNAGHATESFGMTLKSTDKYILEEFKKDLNSTYPIHEYTSDMYFDNKYYGKSSCCKILIKSKKIFSSLTNLGLTVNKTYNATLPLNMVPPILWNHLIRGYFDGDGGFSIPGEKENHTYSITFTGTVEVISSIRHVLGKDNVKLCSRFPDRNNNNCSLVLCGDKQCYNIGSWLYGNATIYLKRKYERYLELYNKYNTKNMVVPTGM